MRNQSFSRLSIQLFLLDLLLTPVGLWLASQVRILLPYGQDLPAEAAQLPWPVYIMAITAWITSLILSGAYDPERVLRWFNEFARIASAAVLATLLLSGALYMTYRETSRLQFIYFLAVNLLLLLGHRSLLRLIDRALGRARAGAVNRILIAGAGELGQRVASVLQDHRRLGYTVVGYLDDDKQKQDQSFEGYPVLELSLIHI